ncbi:MAG: 1-deoxy-D-xylulose-5-phosphate synthase [Anaerorhabdus sp.]
MEIKDIQSPLFLKNMSVEECNKLSNDIRKFLIENISKTGGHLSSNLGVVELTIAMHKVFNSPEDKFLFDVGHQSYIHKILTGRASNFSTLRQYGGISGFQKRNESIHDCWEAGHSSTALSAALGKAIARDLDGENYQVIPIVGDGSIVSGMSLEALNQIGTEQRNMVIIFNDNNMSISQNIGALTTGFSRLRTSAPYTTAKKDIKDLLNKNAVGKNVLSSIKQIKDKFKDSIIDQGIFAEFSIEYLGPVDGHNIKDLLSVLESAKKHEGPVVVHVITKKGKGYEPCEKDINGQWHGVGPFDIATGQQLGGLPANMLSWSEVISETVCSLAKTNTDIVALTPAMIYGSKLAKFFAAYPKRSFDCGIAEDHAATLAAGLASSDKRPFLAIYSSFLQRCYDQINHDIGRMDLPVVIGVDRAGLVGEDGDTHHGVFDISILKSIPNLILCQPKDAAEAQLLLTTGFSQNHPFLIRYPRGSVAYQQLETFTPITIGSWVSVCKPTNPQVVVCAYGPEVDKIAQKVSNNDLAVEVINCRFFKPLDESMLNYLAELNCPIIVYETDMLEGGLGTSILEWSCDQVKPLQIHRLGIPDQFIQHGATSQLRKEIKIDTESLFKKIQSLL